MNLCFHQTNFLFLKRTITVTWAIPQKDFIKEQVQINFCRSSGPGGQNVNKRYRVSDEESTKAEVRFNVNEATWIPEEIKIHFIKITSNKQNSEGEYITSSDHSRTQELNLSNCLNQIRQLLEDAYRLANGGVTKKQLKMDKIKRNNDRNRRRRAKKEALIATLLNSKSMPTKDLSANSMEATGNVRIKLNSKDPLPKTTTTKLPIMQSIPTESTQFSPLTRNKHETFE